MNIKKELDRIKEVRVNRTDEQCEMLSQQKLARHYEDLIEGKADQKLVRLTDFGLYQCFIPLPEKETQTTHLSVGYMYSHSTPTPEEFLEITPIDLVEDSADDYKEKTGIDIREAAFNSFQDCLRNPHKITFSKLSKEEIKSLTSGRRDEVRTND